MASWLHKDFMLSTTVSVEKIQSVSIFVELRVDQVSEMVCKMIAI